MSATGVQGRGQRFTGLQARAVGFCFILNVLNGADVLVVSYSAPFIGQQWALSDQMLGAVFSAGLAGMTVGALALGPLSDLLGRKTMILAAGVLIATGMAAGGLAADAGALMLFRFWGGLGIGSMLAGVTATASEYAPPKHRSLAVTVASAGFPAGAIATSFAANAVLPVHGWPALFFALSALSALLLPLCLRWLPESTEFLLARQPANALKRANRILKADGAPAMAALPPKSAGAVGGPSPRRLLSADHRRDTLLLWAAFFGAFVTLYFLLSWIPSIAVDAGLPMEHAIQAGAAYHSGSVAGHVLIGWLSLRFSLTSLIAVFFTLAALLLPVFGAAHDPASLFLVEIFALGVLALGGFGGLYALAARTYPADIRATGVGWALGAGRLGAVLGPYLGGVFMDRGAGLFASLLVFAFPLAAAGLATAAIGARRSASAQPETPPSMAG